MICSAQAVSETSSIGPTAITAHKTRPGVASRYVWSRARGRPRTRMRPLTDRRPKPLLPVGDRSLLEQVFDTAVDVVDEFVVVTGYRGDAIRESIGESYRDRPVTYVEQEEARGRLTPSHKPRLSWTTTSSCSTGTWLSTRRSLEYSPTLTGPRLRRPKLSIHVRMAYSRRPLTDRSRKSSKPANPPTNLANVGCYAFTPEVFEYIDRTPESERGEYGSRRRSNCCSTTATGLTWRPTWGRGSTSVARGSC